MVDFTKNTLKSLILALSKQGYSFYTFNKLTDSDKKTKAIILRHDIDKIPRNALKIAKLENELGVVGSYYFRSLPCSYNEEIIKQIAALGHEIGYHYENLSVNKGAFEKAIEDFKSNLNKFRAIADVKTICMHGSPLSKWDNRKLWEKYDYRDFGIIAEPYFDVDFSQVLYLTDTGRRWDGEKVSIRDKVTPTTPIPYTLYPIPISHPFKKTKDIISAAEQGLLPDKIMITIHPQRWTDSPLPWMKELIWQNVKNVVKKAIVKN
ncbi:MAG: hypothetical protein KGZ97_10785 [Bacteroidetes bacterium]|nr:hypothetical protein [Bacteroidota bacterium]